jgi:hypothetical protein
LGHVEPGHDCIGAVRAEFPGKPGLVAGFAPYSQVAIVDVTGLGHLGHDLGPLSAAAAAVVAMLAAALAGGSSQAPGKTPPYGRLHNGGVPDYLSIGDFSRATHMTVKTLRHYHQIGLLKPAEVDACTSYRRYGTDQIPVAQVISRFRELDMPLGEIQGVLSAPDL